MSKPTRSEDEAARIDKTRSVPVLLYDASCSMCNELAYKVRDRADQSLRLVALSDPEADELLTPHYADSWSEDFYFIKGTTARKGKRALPSVMKTVGVKDFTALMGDYLRHHQNRGSDCDHDHEEGKAKSNFSRRSFVGAAATVGTTLFAGTAWGSEYHGRPPRGLDARVARVSPDGRDGFDVTIERENNLIRREKWKPSPQPSINETSTGAQKTVSMDSVGTETLVDRDSLKIQREDLDLTPETDDESLKRALSMSSSSQSGTARMTRYGVLDERERYGFSLNFAEGPMKVDERAEVGSTLSGRISHDVARKTVDFVKFESDGPAGIATHLRGYVAGMRAYQQHYSDHEDQKMAGLYREMAEHLTENASTIAESTDGTFEPVSNVLSISSVPFWTEYVESPTTEDSDRYQATDVTGTSCDCSCCSLGCCTGCDCGCSICIGTPKPGCGCGCCIGGCGAGCGCGCCYCVA